MSNAFENLSREGKINKIREHLQQPGGYPVPAPWVKWLLSERGYVSTDVVVDAARTTREVYKGLATKLGSRHPDSVNLINEMKRVAVMDALCNDDNLCEMFAGRIYQVSHGEPRR
jgi:hypothetical protein